MSHKPSSWRPKIAISPISILRESMEDIDSDDFLSGEKVVFRKPLTGTYNGRPCVVVAQRLSEAGSFMEFTDRPQHFIVTIRFTDNRAGESRAMEVLDDTFIRHFRNS